VPPAFGPLLPEYLEAYPKALRDFAGVKWVNPPRFSEVQDSVPALGGTLLPLTFLDGPEIYQAALWYRRISRGGEFVAIQTQGVPRELEDLFF
jgi:hypothetical protein